MHTIRVMIGSEPHIGGPYYSVYIYIYIYIYIRVDLFIGVSRIASIDKGFDEGYHRYLITDNLSPS